MDGFWDVYMSIAAWALCINLLGHEKKKLEIKMKAERVRTLGVMGKIANKNLTALIVNHIRDRTAHTFEYPTQ